MRKNFLLAMLLLALPAQAQEDSFVWGERRFFPLRDVNVAEYEPDFAWQRLSERERQRKSGIDFWYGSLSEEKLGVERRLQLNYPLTERLHFRWQHEEITIEEIEAGSEKIELQYAVAGPLSLTLSGTGVLEKRAAAIGAGVLVATKDRLQYLDLTVRNDAAVHDARTPFDAKDRHPPIRVLAESNVELAPVRVYAFADWALEHRRVYETHPGSGGIRDRRRYTRRTELKAEWAVNENAVVGARHRFSGEGDERRHFTDYDDPETRLRDYDFERTHHRVDVFGEGRISPWRARAIAGYWVQSDAADFAIGPDTDYVRTQLLFGARLHRTITPEIEIGAGYWGNVMTADLEPRQPALRRRRARDEAYYVDKGDVVFGYRFHATARLELLLSQEITRGEFGGGCGKAVFLF